MKISWIKTVKDIEGDTYYRLYVFDLRRLKLHKSILSRSLSVILNIYQSVVVNWPINIIINHRHFDERSVNENYIFFNFNPVQEKWEFSKIIISKYKKDINSYIQESSYIGYPNVHIETTSSYL